ncbi:response regulator [Paenibacillus thermoaerophilus]|nr:response regulator [Paenibacillus thermoaerophilus]
MLRGIVSSAGHEIAGEADNGLKAVAQYRSLRPHLVLMDVMMPVMDGFTAARMIRRLDPAARFVICTARTDESTVAEAMACGAADIVAKPFQESRLLQAIWRGLRDAPPSAVPPIDRQASPAEVGPARPRPNTCGT